jgi:hypothetical protein
VAAPPAMAKLESLAPYFVWSFAIGRPQLESVL